VLSISVAEDNPPLVQVAVCQVDFADLEPNELKVYWLDLKKDLEGDANPKNAKFRGKLHLEVEYRPFVGEDPSPVEVEGVVGGENGTEITQPDVEIPEGGGLLSINIQQGLDLMPVDRGTCNAYVEFKFRNETHFTKVRRFLHGVLAFALLLGWVGCLVKCRHVVSESWILNSHIVEAVFMQWFAGDS
jgi:hypothetical protein